MSLRPHPAKNLPVLRVSIQSPCEEDWGAMVGRRAVAALQAL
jgi:hypothetical protein